MAFSALTCITLTGTTPLGPTIFFYSNNDSFTTSFGDAPLSSLIGENCPYTITGIPNGTTTIRFKDPTTNCCVDVPVEPTLDVCIFCNLGFNIYSSTTVSEIVVGNLTGTCDSNITDYVVNWYGPGVGSTNVAFTSGKGSEFSYTWTHPLTGSSSVFVPPGIYTPIVESVIINGTSLYDDLGATADCFEPITVEPFTCSNGTPIFNYEHRVEFSNISGEIPQSLSSYFLLDATTNYFAWAFKALTVSDTLKISYSGANYTTPIVIEYITLGDQVTTDLNPNILPKSGKTFTNFYAKTNCLTGFTYSSGDILIIEVTPNPTNINTQWELYFTCLENFNCDTCLDVTTPYKIIRSSITGITGSCDTITIDLNLSGCSTNTNNSYDIFKYYIPLQPNAYLFNNSFLRLYVDFNNNDNLNDLTLPLFDSPFRFESISCSLQSAYLKLPNVCSVETDTIISLKSYLLNSTQRKVELRFSDINDYNAYITSFNDAMFFSGSTDPNNIDYYRYLNLAIPEPEGDVPCGDDTTRLLYVFHPSTLNITVGTGSSPENYKIDITASTISNQLNFNECDLNCNSSINQVLINVNGYVTATTHNFTGTTTSGSRYIEPFYQMVKAISGSSFNTGQTISGFIKIPQYTNETYAFSGDPLTIIPSLSARTCNNLESKMTLQNNAYGVNKGNEYVQYAYYYDVQLTNPNDIRDFRIYASSITNGVYSGYPSIGTNNVFVYGFSGGSEYFYDSNYVI